MNAKNSKLPGIVVAGDFWLLRKLVVSPNDTPASPWRSWQSAREFDFLMGTYYIELLLKAFREHPMNDEKPPFDIFGPSTAGPFAAKGGERQGLFDLAEPEHCALQRVSVREVPRALDSPYRDTAWRLDDTFDFNVPPNLHQIKRRSLKAGLRAKTLVLDASGLYLHDVETIRDWKTLSDYIGVPAEKRDRWLICKIKDRCSKWSGDGEAIQKERDNLNEVLQEALRAHPNSIVVIPIDDLRASGRPISYGVSWERTFQMTIDLINAYPGPRASSGELRHAFLGDARHIIVSLVPDGIIYARRSIDKNQKLGRIEFATLFFDPYGAERSMANKAPGFVGGGDSLIAASLAYHLNDLPHDRTEIDSTKTIAKALTSALKASRVAQLCGLISVPRSIGDVTGPKYLRRKLKICLDEESKDLYRSELWKMPPGQVNAALCETAIEFYRQSLGHLPEATQAFGAGAQGETPLMPVDLIADIVVTGDCRQFEWLGERPPQGFDLDVAKKFQGQRRKLHQLVERVWIDAGWVFEHNFEFSPEVCKPDTPLWSLQNWFERRSMESTVSSAGSSYDVAWFSMLTNFVEMVGSDQRRSPEEMVKILAKFVLRNGPSALFDHLRRSVTDSNPLFLRLSATTHYDAFPIARYAGLYLFTREEVEAARGLERLFRDYISAGLSHHSRSPLSVAVVGPPGSGKSSLIKRILSHLSGQQLRSSILEFNMSQLTSKKELELAFLEIVNIAASGKTPVVFFDEFDSTFGDKSYGWLESFLMPMNDGKFVHGGSTRDLPRSIYVFGGSRIRSITDERLTIPNERNPNSGAEHDGSREACEPKELAAWLEAKGADFVSRLALAIEVKGVNSLARGVSQKEDRYGHFFRRAMVLRHLLSERFPKLFDDQEVLSINEEVADLFIGAEEFAHQVRSIDRIVSLCDLENRNTFDASGLPTGAQLRLHVDPAVFELPSIRL